MRYGESIGAQEEDYDANGLTRNYYAVVVSEDNIAIRGYVQCSGDLHMHVVVDVGRAEQRTDCGTSACKLKSVFAVGNGVESESERLYPTSGRG